MYTGFNPCTGEDLMGTGNMRFTVSDSLGTDGFIHHHLSTRIDGLQATALVSGKKEIDPAAATPEQWNEAIAKVKPEIDKEHEE